MLNLEERTLLRNMNYEHQPKMCGVNLPDDEDLNWKTLSTLLFVN